MKAYSMLSVVAERGIQIKEFFPVPMQDRMNFLQEYRIDFMNLDHDREHIFFRVINSQQVPICEGTIKKDDLQALIMYVPRGTQEEKC